jgi:exopolysaccharide biosynthesis protein
MRNGEEHITQRRDGFVHVDDPSFAYGWVLQRNPRTFAGIDARGRTVLVTVDGRTTDDLGLSIPEAADVARSLGLVDAVNLDGGGSTTMALRGQVISHPSDTTGERPVGDAVLVLPPEPCASC